MIALLLAVAALNPTGPVPAAPSNTACEGGPVLMVVACPTHDRARMLAYGKAIADSGLYQKLGGYYANVQCPAATFEGTPPPAIDPHRPVFLPGQRAGFLELGGTSEPDQATAAGSPGRRIV